jgi:type VI secretion system secreted protein VgrG
MADTTTRALELAHYTLGTHERPIRLTLACPDGIRDDILLPQRMIGNEDICGGFEHRILCVADDAELALKDFIGLPAELRIVTDTGRLRRICGIVTEAASGQSDGALATYELVIRDALSVMERRKNTRVFRNKSELDVVRILVAEWRQRNGVLRETFDLDVALGLDNRCPTRELIMQHNESDAAFIRRLLQRRGIAWFFRSGLPEFRRHQAQRDAIGHTLVLFNDSTQLTRNAAGTVRFHRDAATEQRDAITGWSAMRIVQPGSMSLHSWNYKQPRVGEFMATSASSLADQGKRGNELAAALDDYHVAAPHIGDTSNDLADLGDLQMAHYEYAAKSFLGEGGVRDLAVGEWFSFSGHPEIDRHRENERQFVITSQRIAAQNNLPVEIGARADRLFNRNGWNVGDYAVFADSDNPGEPIRYKTRFTCVRRGIRIVPPCPALPRPELQTAIVVGPVNEEVWCDELGRVKIRFPATRPEDHAHAGGAGSSNSDIDSAWVRVASSWAGSALGTRGPCGTRLLPPVGSEVLVAFAGGDPDKPIIIAQLFNGAASPPAFRHEGGLPTTKYQSGIRSREIRGKRGNQLRLDDTPGQISAQLASDHAGAELNLGYLTELRRDGRTAPRGEGAELRSEEAIALRAARGILLSTWKLLDGAGLKGRQLARDDYLDLLRECGELCAALGDYAAEHNGLPIDTKEQKDLLARFKTWEDGSNTVPDATERGEPVIGVTSPAGIGFASTQAIVSYSGRNIDTVAQQHLQLTAGQRFNLNAGKGISLFAQSGGFTGIAHAGKVLLQSQHDDTDINSAKNLTLTATEGTTTISAKVILLVAEDGSFLKLGDGPPVLGSKHPLKFHAPDFLYDEPETMTARLPTFGQGRADQKLMVRYAPGIPLENGERPPGAVVKDAKLKIALSDGTAMQARSGADGKSDLIERDAMHIAEISLMRGGDQ